MSSLSVEQRLEIKTAAQQLLKQLNVENETLESEIAPVEPDVSLGRLTRMEAIQSNEMKKAQLQRNLLRLKGIENTLLRVDDEEFGVCIECEEPIPFARLKIVPESRLCLNCK
ncbi:conjugal transfer protein TraR [bacterium]|nr:conjugal transfer protein TraR [bacterium]